MLIALAGLMAAVAFVVLVRLLWLSARPARSTTMITAAAAVLVIGLAILAATGRLHWIVAVGAALLPFLKRAISLLRYLPWIKGAFGAYQQTRGNSNTGTANGDLSVEDACRILGLGSHPTRDEVIAAHRSLMQKLHPDRGGSTYLAQQLNDAKRVLLKHIG
ncbi:MAG: molecular chaperone DnaJ [Pseudomonadales bacterium]